MNIKSISYHIGESLLSKYPLRIYLLQNFLKKTGFGSYKFRLEIDAFRYPAYAYGMYCSALQAKGLGLKKISVIEFGVAAGHGILEMEAYANEILTEIGVEIEIYGFDSGFGLPISSNYKDQLYFWSEGDFKQNRELLSSKLKKSKIIYGDINQTIVTYLEEFKPAPIGFISFDLDYYTSTIAAFQLLDGNNNYFLPRVECYLDDINSSELLCASSETGVRRAVLEYNEERLNKILKKEGVQAFRRYPSSWNENLFICHRFDHANYSDKLNADGGFQISLS